MGKGVRSLFCLLGSVGMLAGAVYWQETPRSAEDASQPLPAVQASGPRFWKGNLHTHSFWSDGDDFPEMIADWYKRHGYHFLALTDHNVLAEGERWMDVPGEESPRGKALKKYLVRYGERWVEQRTLEKKAQVRLKPLREFRSLLEEPARFLLIPAEEITHKFAKAPVHMNALNLRDVVRPLNGDGVAETIQVNMRSVAEQRKRTGWPMIAVLNHPNFQWGVRAEDVVLTEEVRYFEVFNGHPGVKNYGDATHVSTERMWDILLALRLGKHRLPIIYGLATDDAHGYHTFGVGKVNPGRGWVMVRAPFLSAEAMVHGLEAGDFYASTGVVLKDIRRVDREVRLSIQPEKGVKYRTQFIATSRGTSLASEPYLDKDGKPLPVTGRFSAEIGKVVAESEDLNPVYKFTGEEWYVRAKVISTRPHPNPFAKGDVEVAWTQPFVP